MIETRIKCDSCRREDLAESATKPPLWGKLVVGGKSSDLCPACIARIDGWVEPSGERPRGSVTFATAR